MAIRSIRIDGDEILRKTSKKVDIINDKIKTLFKDMADTMYKAEGVGLAAPQIGILKRLVVVDVGDGLMELVNPVVLEESGEQVEIEGCLSVPDVLGEVKRPEKVVVKALNVNGKEILIEGDGLLAIALCHEIDHLNGILFKDKAVRLIDKNDADKHN